jgi:hypothetical protein
MLTALLRVAVVIIIIGHARRIARSLRADLIHYRAAGWIRGISVAERFFILEARLSGALNRHPQERDHRRRHKSGSCESPVVRAADRGTMILIPSSCNMDYSEFVLVRTSVCILRL